MFIVSPDLHLVSVVGHRLTQPLNPFTTYIFLFDFVRTEQRLQRNQIPAIRYVHRDAHVRVYNGNTFTFPSSKNKFSRKSLVALGLYTRTSPGSAYLRELGQANFRPVEIEYSLQLHYF